MEDWSSLFQEKIIAQLLTRRHFVDLVRIHRARDRPIISTKSDEE